MAVSARQLWYRLCPVEGRYPNGAEYDWTRPPAILAWLEGVLTAGGWTRTADTGQTTSSDAISALGTYYQVWTPNDGGTPVYLRFDLTISVWAGDGYDNVMRTAMTLAFQVGTGTSGAGALAGNMGPKVTTHVSKPFNAYSEDTYGSPGRWCYATAGPGRFSMLWQVGSGVIRPTYFSVERSVDTGGIPTGEAVHQHSIEIGGSALSAAVPFPPAIVPATNAYWGVLLNSGNGTFAAGNRIGVSPVFPLYAGVRSPITSAILYKGADIAAPRAVPLKIHGATRTYFCPGLAASAAVPGGNSGAQLGMLWE